MASSAPRPAYWRMNLHPGDTNRAMMYAVQALGRNIIGFNYGENDPGDLTALEASDLPKNVGLGEWRAAAEVQDGDQVLVMVHNVPFALATVDGEYNYLRTPVPEISDWINHFWRVRDMRYYADRPNNPPGQWVNIPATMTLQRLTEADTQSRRLIDDWD